MATAWTEGVFYTMDSILPVTSAYLERSDDRSQMFLVVDGQKYELVTQILGRRHLADLVRMHQLGSSAWTELDDQLMEYRFMSLTKGGIGHWIHPNDDEQPPTLH